MSDSAIAEKAHVSPTEDVAVRKDEMSSEQSPEPPSAEDAALDRSTLLRLDLVLVPLMVMLYFLAWLDRANIGNARVVCSFATTDLVCYANAHL